MLRRATMSGGFRRHERRRAAGNSGADPGAAIGSEKSSYGRAVTAVDPAHFLRCNNLKLQGFIGGFWSRKRHIDEASATSR
jgi:hypothetical protein